MTESKTVTRIDVRQKILADNQAAAEGLRDSLQRAGTLCLNLISSPGSGKTTLLEATVSQLSPRLRTGVLVGDVATQRDAERIARRGVSARQILTGGSCHLDARLVRNALQEAAWRGLDVLFIENVGNLICPTAYDLGEDSKVVVLSVTEGDDKPFKYPAIFARAEIALITKIDLLPHVEFDLHAVRDQISALNPQGVILACSAKTGEGMSDWFRLVENRLANKREIG